MSLLAAPPIMEPPRRLSRRRSLSLERKLPLLMTGMLAVVLAGSLFLTYRTLTHSAEQSAGDRLARAVLGVASSADVTLAERARELRLLTALPGVAGALTRSLDTTAARSAMVRAHAQPDSLPVEVWDARGNRVLFIGSPDRSEWRAPFSRDSLVASLPRPVGTRVTFSPLYIAGGAVYFWTVAPVLEDGRVIGHVAHERRVSGPADAAQSLREVIGEDVTMYIHNADYSNWASMRGRPEVAPVSRTPREQGTRLVRPQIGPILSAEARVTGTPWVLSLETPLRAVHARARATLTTLTFLSVLLVAVGGAISWAISRRLTRPLVSLTTAAEAVAQGDYGRRVNVRGNDEIGRLSASFNQMAAEVAASRRELEERVLDAQSAAKALSLANTQLHDAIREAHTAREEAEHANRAKSDFLAVMSHELRTPLNAIGGYAQLLELGVHGPVNEAQRDALARLARSQAHLLRLITDVLSFAKIDAGQAEYTITDVSVDDALSNVEPLVAPQLRAKHIAFACQHCDPSLSVRADREKLEQILLNLLSNAIKFTPDGGRVTMNAEASGTTALMHVRDTGIGIPVDRLERVFEPFVQGDRALNRPHEGVGLGLAISRDLARAMGGDLNVQSVVGHGSIFTLSLPRVSAEMQSSGPGRAPARQSV